MNIRKECINNFKISYLMTQNKEPTLINIAKDLNRNVNYIRQIFSFRTTSMKLAKQICDLANMEIEELFYKGGNENEF